jgi:hypothetical protein
VSRDVPSHAVHSRKPHASILKIDVVHQVMQCDMRVIAESRISAGTVSPAKAATGLLRK